MKDIYERCRPASACIHGCTHGMWQISAFVYIYRFCVGLTSQGAWEEGTWCCLIWPHELQPSHDECCAGTRPVSARWMRISWRFFPAACRPRHFPNFPQSNQYNDLLVQQGHASVHCICMRDVMAAWPPCVVGLQHHNSHYCVPRPSAGTAPCRACALQCMIAA